jgi:hypothetical protein
MWKRMHELYKHKGYVTWIRVLARSYSRLRPCGAGTCALTRAPQLKRSPAGSLQGRKRMPEKVSTRGEITKGGNRERRNERTLRRQLGGRLAVLLLDVGGVRLHLLARLGACVRPRVDGPRGPRRVVGLDGAARSAGGSLRLGGVDLGVQLVEDKRGKCQKLAPGDGGCQAQGRKEVQPTGAAGEETPGQGWRQFVARTGAGAKGGPGAGARRAGDLTPRAVNPTRTQTTPHALVAHLLDLLVQVVALVLGLGLWRQGTKAR